MNNELSETAETILLLMKKSPYGTDSVGKLMSIESLEHHFGEKRMPKVEEAIEELTAADFIEPFEEEIDIWRMTPYGLSYLAKKGQRAGSIFSNIQNSNIANSSPGARQTIEIKDLDPDILAKITELEVALKSKDKNKIKQTLSYILDKSIDVGVAIISGQLIK